MDTSKKYFELLRDRKKISRTYSKHQSLGLYIAEVLNDRSHKTLYMRLVKEYNGELLLAVAKDIAERSGVANKGAYFMKIFAKFRKNLPKKAVPAKPKIKQLKLRFRKTKK